MDRTKILIVDDHLENITALSRLIEAADIEIFSATNAEEALDLLVGNDFGLALLDVQMPNITGFDLARLIRGVKRFKDLPVIFVTAFQQDQAVVLEGYDTGAVDLLFKPLDPHVVRSKVRVFVKLDQQSKILRSQMSELERLKGVAEAANLAKGQFLANMSHEIRTPLAAVLGFADIMVENGLEEEKKKEYLQAIRRNGQLLLRLIDEILDFSKVESQKLEFEEITFDLEELIGDVTAALTLKAITKGVDLKVKGVESAAGNYSSDPSRIKQVLLNIIGNAIKFTPNGKVDVEVRTKKTTSENNPKAMLTFIVTDTGIGLTPAQIERLFRPFSQGDASTRRQFGGTGLGLMISKEIAKAMGGDIKLVQSVEGVGSTFEITFAVTPATNKTVEAVVSKNVVTGNRHLKGKKILAIDDSPDNRVLIELYLKDAEIHLFEASSGKEGIAIVEAKDPDLILMDIQMPEMDGYEATRTLRALGYKKTIVALTAHALKEEHERCKSAGCDYILTKPINRQKLLENLDQFFADAT